FFFFFFSFFYIWIENHETKRDASQEVSEHDSKIEDESCDLNYNIVSILQEMQRIYELMGDNWREFAYKRACGIVKMFPKKIETEADVALLLKTKGFSKKLGAKVLEIIQTGQLKKLNELKKLPQIEASNLFMGIWNQTSLCGNRGVGHQTVTQWYRLGYRTLDDVREKAALNERQKIGLKYYDDLRAKIPRCEVEEIEHFVKKEVMKIESECALVTCGSYRRGKAESGDVDLLITHPRAKKIVGLLEKIVDQLNKAGFLKDHFSLPSHKNKHAVDHHDTYMGICKLPDTADGRVYKYCRHLDIKVFPPAAFPFALLYFTGSDHFNRSMRYFAKKKGYTLSSYQLAPAIRLNNHKTHTGQPILCSSEEQVFEVLGLKYVKPCDRNNHEYFEFS
ncbi:DNA-directed DNA polymerase lambda, partial [Reticulomyxa filosa]